MKNIKISMNGVIFCLLEIAVGILLLIDPLMFTTRIINIAGIAAMIAGVFSILQYFIKDTEEASAGQYLFKGLVLLLCGAFCSFNAEWFIVTFPTLTMVYGIVVLITGLSKIQQLADMLRQKNKRWYMPVIHGSVSLICAALILSNPFKAATAIWMFIGITLIVQAAVELTAKIMMRVDKKIREAAESESIEASE